MSGQVRRGFIDQRLFLAETWLVQFRAEEFEAMIVLGTCIGLQSYIYYSDFPLAHRPVCSIALESRIERDKHPLQMS
jgi:hypothetical protein